MTGEHSWRDKKLAALNQEHVLPLNDPVRRWRRRWPDRTIPWFDPDDGGIGATVLLLMEAPGPRTAAVGEDGFCSEDNDDPTARAIRTVRASSGLVRASYLKWNIVPWALLHGDGGWRSPRPADLEQSQELLSELLPLLTELRLVVTAGRPALHGWTRHQSLHVDRVIPLLAVPHPSQRNTAARAESRLRLENAFAFAAALT